MTNSDIVYLKKSFINVPYEHYCGWSPEYSAIQITIHPSTHQEPFPNDVIRNVSSQVTKYLSQSITRVEVKGLP